MSSHDVHDVATRAVHAGVEPDPTTGAILTPIYQTTTYVQAGVGQDKGFTYSRAANPTVSALERCLGDLDDAPPAVCFASGLAAVTTLFLSTLKGGDHVVVSDVVYGGTVRLLRQVLADLGISATFVDTARAANIVPALQANTKLVLIETPANPTLKLTDIAAVSRITRAAGVRLAVDNTFLTPVLQRCFDLGADITLYSTTKHIEGHNAAVGGSLATRDEKLLDRFRFIRKTLGCIAAPFDSWLTLRGVKTLPLRIRQHTEHATEVARWLEKHPRVARVAYPGLDSFPQAELARRQHLGHGGLVAFEVVGGTPAGISVMNNVELCSLAESLGAVETLITHPASMTHGDIPRDERERLGITDGLIRLSVGLESPKDIIADLDRALGIADEHLRNAPVVTTTPAAKEVACPSSL
jgi:cystathionine beta-lyase/cystathionine gamma-synthase